MNDRIEIIGRGLFVQEGMVLICRNRGGGYTFLPGGHVEFGESALEATRREFVEELGVQPELSDTPLLVCEQRFTQSGVRRHELTIVFHVERCGGLGPSRPVEAIEAHLELLWTSIAELDSQRLLPRAVSEWVGGQVGSSVHRSPEPRRPQAPTLSPSMCWLSLTEAAGS